MDLYVAQGIFFPFSPQVISIAKKILCKVVCSGRETNHSSTLHRQLSLDFLLVLDQLIFLGENCWNTTTSFATEVQMYPNGSSRLISSSGDVYRFFFFSSLQLRIFLEVSNYICDKLSKILFSLKTTCAFITAVYYRPCI